MIFLTLKDPSERGVQTLLPKVAPCQFSAQTCLCMVAQGSLLIAMNL